MGPGVIRNVEAACHSFARRSIYIPLIMTRRGLLDVLLQFLI